jgi:hypothetical protein
VIVTKNVVMFRLLMHKVMVIDEETDLAILLLRDF